MKRKTSSYGKVSNNSIDRSILQKIWYGPKKLHPNQETKPK